ncbi:hypothetical protein F4777DRAFT_582222 [Nemania sp. FL0916]|nr:hypothetical protein F4777DRAFT_582222 [Nemania sp. FL0916]
MSPNKQSPPPTASSVSELSRQLASAANSLASALDHSPEAISHDAAIKTSKQINNILSRVGEIKETCDIILQRQEEFDEDAEKRNAVREMNSIIRKRNYHATSTQPHRPLERLYSVVTGRPIEHFPKSTSEIDATNSNQLNRLLADLGYPNVKHEEQKKITLKLLAGICDVE